jgi:hypothetical protein
VKALAVLLSLATFTAAPAAGAVARGFSFGRSGGNIRPLEVRISAAGRVVVDSERRGVLTQARLRALQRIVERERFVALPARIVCKGVLPDIAIRHVVASGRTVAAHGGCSARFNRVYAELARAAGVT